jgi:PLP dependent protein
MSINQESYKKLIAEFGDKITLVAVSKTKPVEDILALYKMGQRDFGENYVQEMVAKATQLPRNILWHFIGHLQSNKVKLIAPFVHLIHGVDRLKLLKEIDKEAAKNKRVLDVLLQVHIAQEETKFGLDEEELDEILCGNNNGINELKNVHVTGLMGMASLTDDMNKVRAEFAHLKRLFDKYEKPSLLSGGQTTNYELRTLSMGMSSDYKIAIDEGNNMVRIGSLIFGERE